VFTLTAPAVEAASAPAPADAPGKGATLRDGVPIDVSAVAREASIHYPVVPTQAAR
jgi:hypothetical protein